MRELWCHEVEGDAFRGLVVESNRVLVWTGKQTLVVSRDGDILGRHEPPLAAPDRRPSLAEGECRYELKEGELLGVDAQGARISRALVPIDPFERQRERILSFFAERTDSTCGCADDMIRRWWRSADLVADPARQRLLVVGFFTPWLAAIQPDGRVDWVLVTGPISACCNTVDVVARDGTLAHFSSCGGRITFVAADGQIVSAHDIQPTPFQLATDGHGVAYVTLDDEGVAAYQPGVGLTGKYAIPHVRQAGVGDGILYAVVEDPRDSFRLQAFEEPA